jgi:hypothetical protein
MACSASRRSCMARPGALLLMMLGITAWPLSPCLLLPSEDSAWNRVLACRPYHQCTWACMVPARSWSRVSKWHVLDTRSLRVARLTCTHLTRSSWRCRCCQEGPGTTPIDYPPATWRSLASAALGSPHALCCGVRQCSTRILYSGNDIAVTCYAHSHMTM